MLNGGGKTEFISLEWVEFEATELGKILQWNNFTSFIKL